MSDPDVSPTSDSPSTPPTSTSMSTMSTMLIFGASVLLLMGGAAIATRMADRPSASSASSTSPSALPSASLPSPSSSSSGASAGDASPMLPNLTVLRNGRPLPLAGPRPKPTLLHLWATWCGPCREELPAILAFGRTGDVEVIALSVDDEWSAVQAYFGDSMPPEVAWDAKIVVEPAMGVRSLPTTIVIDTSGRVRRTLVGARDWSDPELRRAVTVFAP